MSANHQQVCHLWASGNKESAKGFNIYFEGRELYSYGSHYLLGFRLSAATFLLNAQKYSVSTSKHQSYASRATHGQTFWIDGLTRYRGELQDLARYANRKGAPAPDAIGQERAESAAVRMIRDLAPRGGNRELLELLADYADISKARARKMIDAAIRAGARDAIAAIKTMANAERAAAVAWSKRPRADTESEIVSQVAILKGDSEYQAGQALHKLDWLAKEAGRNHRAASKAGLSKRTVAAIWWHVKAYRAAIADHKAKREQRERLAAFASHANNLRKMLATVATMPESVESPGYVFGAFRSIHTSAWLLARPLCVPAATRAKLASLEAWALERGNREETESARIANIKKAAEIAAWRQGGPRVYFDSDYGGAAIRATDVERDASGAIIGGTLETSHSASVPLIHAIKAFRFVKLCRERGTGWASNGRIIRVGYYQIDGITADGDFKAGCHNFKWPEIAALAESLGVFDLAPDESAVVANPSH